MSEQDASFWSDIASHYDAFLEAAELILMSYITTINPRVIVLTGKNVSPAVTDDLLARLQKRLPKEHIPELIQIENIEPYYVKGLFEKTIVRK